MSRVAEGGTAFGNRQASHVITLDGVWRPGEDYGDRDTAWAREFFAALGRFREGVYVNFLGGDEDPGRVPRGVRQFRLRSAGERENQVRPAFTSSTITKTSDPEVSNGVSGSNGAGDALGAKNLTS